MFSQNLSVSVSYKVVSYMQDFAVQITWLAAMVTKISLATITKTDSFSQKVTSYQIWSFYASKKLR